jgi:hypothetical protein
VRADPPETENKRYPLQSRSVNIQNTDSNQTTIIKKDLNASQKNKSKRNTSETVRNQTEKMSDVDELDAIW